jgi:hypothetical protein
MHDDSVYAEDSRARKRGREVRAIGSCCLIHCPSQQADSGLFLRERCYCSAHSGQRPQTQPSHVNCKQLTRDCYDGTLILSPNVTQGTEIDTPNCYTASQAIDNLHRGDVVASVSTTRFSCTAYNSCNGCVKQPLLGVSPTHQCPPWHPDLQ